VDARKISWGVVAESWQAVFLGLAVDMLPCPHLAARAHVLGLGHPQRVEGRGGDNHRGQDLRQGRAGPWPVSFAARPGV